MKIRREFVIKLAHGFAMGSFVCSFWILNTVLAFFSTHSRVVVNTVGAFGAHAYFGTFLVAGFLGLAIIGKDGCGDKVKPMWRWLIASGWSFALQSIIAFIALRHAGVI